MKNKKTIFCLLTCLVLVLCAGIGVASAYEAVSWGSFNGVIEDGTYKYTYGTKPVNYTKVAQTLSWCRQGDTYDIYAPYGRLRGQLSSCGVYYPSSSTYREWCQPGDWIPNQLFVDVDADDTGTSRIKSYTQGAYDVWATYIGAHIIP